MKTCCVTGHRNLSKEKLDIIKDKLREEIVLAINDGFTRFISGMANGVDQLFVELVYEAKADHPSLFIEAALPYANRALDIGVNALLSKCNGVKVISQEYHANCMMQRNRYMVEESECVIAVYDGRESGGTLFTMRHAHINDREVRVIDCK